MITVLWIVGETSEQGWYRMKELTRAILLEASYQSWISTQGVNYDSKEIWIDWCGIIPTEDMCDCMDCSIAGEPTH